MEIGGMHDVAAEIRRQYGPKQITEVSLALVIIFILLVTLHFVDSSWPI